MSKSSKKSLLTAAQIAAIQTLPAFSRRVLLVLLKALYAEPGFSDVGVDDLAANTGATMKQVKGALTTLKKAELAWSNEIEVNGKDVTFLFSQLHDDNDGENGDKRKAEAIALLESLETDKGAAPAVTAAEVEETKPVAKKSSKKPVTPQVDALPGVAPLGLKDLVQVRLTGTQSEVIAPLAEQLQKEESLKLVREGKGWAIYSLTRKGADKMRAEFNTRSTKAGGYDMPLHHYAVSGAAARHLSLVLDHGLVLNAKEKAAPKAKQNATTKAANKLREALLADQPTDVETIAALHALAAVINGL